MKPSKTVSKLKHLFQRNYDFYVKTIISILLLIAIATIIWFGGPHVAWKNSYPLLSPEKRHYIILFLFLIWLLKFIIFDLDNTVIKSNSENLQEKFKALESRFRGALQFLKKTNITKKGERINLNQLPWYLLIGSAQAGKTSLLTNADINFILRRQFQAKDKPEASVNCDWWITRDVTIIDVPGNYISSQVQIPPANNTQALTMLWNHLLRLIRKYRGQEGIQGLIIAIPLPEIMQKNEAKNYLLLFEQMLQRIRDIKKYFKENLPCFFVISKCDLLPGFNEFFADISVEEVHQAWGVSLSDLKNSEKIGDSFISRFDALIRNLNQQLISRLHQERNPAIRPFIKDFPLQIERVKECIHDILKKCAAEDLPISLQGIYLTSALQTQPETASIPHNETTSVRDVQIYQGPPATTRPYFIKQFLSHGLSIRKITLPAPNRSTFRRRFAYLTSILIIGFAAVIMGRDFEQGVNQTYSIQKYLTEFELSLQKTQDPEDHIIKTILLLDTLQESAKHAPFKLNLSHLKAFYTHKAQQKTQIIYQNTLQTILLPQIKDFLEAYLKLAINHNTDSVYVALKLYLMLGDTQSIQPTFFIHTIQQILPKSMGDTKIARLTDHLTTAITPGFKSLTLNPEVVQQTRKYLTALPNLQLSYIILKNMNNNTENTHIALGFNNDDNMVFLSDHDMRSIANMYTARAFPRIIAQEIMLAAEEATVGNWVLGNDILKHADTTTPLSDQLHTAYINNYIEIWENKLTDIHLVKPDSLNDIDQVITSLISTHSPLLQFLQTVHDNTFFEPIQSLSPKLQSLGAMLEKKQSSNNDVYQILAALRSVHQRMRVILTSTNEKKAAFEFVSDRMMHHGTTDVLTDLRLIAEKNPEPVKTWLDDIANNAWRFLMQDASHYLDTSWNNQVFHFYKDDIANHYPFASHTKPEVNLQKFANFFGNPGIFLNFYNQYLQAFIDTSTHEWRWKSIDNSKLPFSDETLRQIQQAIHIHHTFFPKGDNQPYAQFSLKPYKISQKIKQVKLKINDKEIIDEKDNEKNTHVVDWPGDQNITSVHFTLANQQPTNLQYPGHWGWFRLLNQSFESMITNKEMLINLSANQYPAKYLLFTDGQFNPLLVLNLHHFYLPSKVTENA